METINNNKELKFIHNLFLNGDEMEEVFKDLKMRSVLEIGSSEGSSACHFIQWLQENGGGELHCVDVWKPYRIEKEIQLRYQMQQVERFIEMFEEHFDQNTSKMLESCPDVSLQKHKMLSIEYLASKVGSEELYDFIYIDGSHHAHDVLLDAQLSFPLLKKGGVMVFDDYLWKPNLEGDIPVNSPKMAIDMFTSLYEADINIINRRIERIFVQKK